MPRVNVLSPCRNSMEASEPSLEATVNAGLFVEVGVKMEPDS